MVTYFLMIDHVLSSDPQVLARVIPTMERAQGLLGTLKVVSDCQPPDDNLLQPRCPRFHLLLETSSSSVADGLDCSGWRTEVTSYSGMRAYKLNKEI
jgi:hypothetical protein